MTVLLAYLSAAQTSVRLCVLTTQVMNVRPAYNYRVGKHLSNVQVLRYPESQLKR
jgi:hypothetical protein